MKTIACISVVAAAAFGAFGETSPFELKGLVHVYDNPLPQLRSRQAIFPNLCELPDGTLLCCFVISEAMESTDARAHLAASGDGGKTWSKPWRMFKDGNPPETEYFKCTSLGGSRVMAIGYGAVRTDPDQPQGNPETGGLLPHRVYWAISEDCGRTWSQKHPIDESWHAQTEASAPLVKLADGTIAAPITGFPDWSGKMTSRLCGRMLATRDGGATWSDDAVCMDFGDGETSCYEQRFCVLDSGTVMDIGWNENLKTGKRLPNHITYSTDNGRTFSKPISTGVMGQASSLCALGGERFLAVVARRRDTNFPGVYGYVCDFSERKWRMESEGVIWSAGGGAIRRDAKMAETFGFLKFGQPSVTRLKDGRLMLCLWHRFDGQFYVDVGEVVMK
ncbi:MAG: exo-alpha-sialidase [Kiritimatiellae bacterium]|nr:exo-alpha-sialidase [Kiritimatiellia bacterium]